MNKNLIEFSIKFDTEQLKIFETDYWLWSLRPHQATIGSGILSLKRDCTKFSELKQEEYCDLKNMIKVIEDTLEELFSYDKINYLMLMMVDKQIHYHVIPRYDKSIELFGEIWCDGSWPGIPNLAGDPLNKEQLMKITNYIKNNLIVSL